ncbi:MAG: peptide ABC transporter permease, partial [Verrucomicrobia bacterium 21-51-4]
MRRYFIRRLLLIPPTLIGITLIVFFITRMVPGGPMEQALMEIKMMGAAGGRMNIAQSQGSALSADQITQMKVYYGLDKPWYAAYVQWVGKVLTGDLGTSYRYNDPVWTMIAQRFPISLFYGVIALICTYTICIPLGVIKAVTHRGWLDNVSSLIVFAG